MLVGTLLGAVLATVLTKEEMAAFGWRIPFVLGGILGLYALYIRSRMTRDGDVHRRSRGDRACGAETGALAADHAASGTAAPRDRPDRGRHGDLLRLGRLGAAFAITNRGIDAKGALWAGVVAQVIFIGVLPLWGMLSDRIGRRRSC